MNNLLRLLRKARQRLQTILLIPALILLMAWMVSPLRDWLTKQVFFDEKTILAAVTIALILMLGLLVDMNNSVSQILHRFVPSSPELIPTGVTKVFPRLQQSLEETKLPHEKRLVVLGLGLNTAWPMIHAWLPSEASRDWDIKLLCLSPEFIRSKPEWFAAEWAQNAQDRCTQISHYMQEEKDSLRDKNTKLTLTPYSLFPAIHGFALGSGDLFVSVIQWSTRSRLLNPPHQFYEHFGPSDKSQRAQEYRNLFKNWTDRAQPAKLI